MNIIFDLGGVVVTWKPENLVQSFTDDLRIQHILLTELIRHPDWIELDRGTLSLPDAIKQCSDRTGLSTEEIYRFMKMVPPSLIPIADTIEIMNTLKYNGHSLFCLSNMHKESIDYLEKTYSFLNAFKGVVVSCRINLVKPDPKIFKHILSIYNLEPAQTLFIDDSPANTESAENLGIKSILFRNAAQCLNDLASMGLI
ncbi:MAG TPA: HAD family phosphatase [Desulfomonilia bacterium]